MTLKRLLLVASCLTYFLVLTVSYATVESNLYDFMGMGYCPPSAPFQLLACLMAVLPGLWLPIAARHPSQICTWILYVTVVVPMMFIPYHVLDRPEKESFFLSLAILTSFGLLNLLLKTPLIRLPPTTIDKQAVHWFLYAGLALVTVVVVFLDGSFQLNLSLDNVYSRRFAAREAVFGGSAIAYAISTLTYSFAPIGLVLGYLRRQYSLVALSLLAFLVVFSFRATKTDLFMPLFLILICLFLRYQKISFGFAAVGGALAIVLASMSEYLLLGTDILSGYVVRRQIMVPSLLTSFYWDYFLDNPLMYYSDRIYGRFFIAPQYDMALTRLIGYEYFGNGEMNANTCFWASAFANLGYLGMMLMTVILAFLLRLFDSIASQGNGILCASMSGAFAIQLSNGALENCIITGGVAMTLVLLYCLQSDASHKQPALRSVVKTVSLLKKAST